MVQNYRKMAFNHILCNDAQNPPKTLFLLKITFV